MNLEMPKPQKVTTWATGFMGKKHRQTHTHWHYSFAKSKERPKLPALHPILSVPPPSNILLNVS
jgi:hypothetical protein